MEGALAAIEFMRGLHEGERAKVGGYAALSIIFF